jgi:phosphatidylglycerol---prolipoprotein diacylglyceryl transferase
LTQGAILGYHENMHPILFTIGGVNFYSYGFFVAMSFFVTYLVFLKLTIDKKFADKLLFEKMLMVLAAGIIGARIMYFILYHQEFSHWYDIFKLWQGGMVSFGGILGGIIAFGIIFKRKLWEYLDIFGVSFLAGAAVWRIGCFMAGDHQGIFSNSWYAINHQVPAILFEIAGSLLGFILFFVLYKKNIFKNFGYLFFSVWIWYGAERLIVDHFRLDPLIWGLRSGQIAGIVMMILGIIGIIYLKFFKREGIYGQGIFKESKSKTASGKKAAGK